MRLSLKQKIVLSLGVVAGIGVLAGAGTFAQFTAQTTNPTNKFATGTLVLSNTVAATTCLSTGGGTTDVNSYSAGCEQVFDVAVQAPGDSATTDITLANVGSLDGDDLRVFSGACSDANAAGESYHGTGSPCGKVQIYIQQWTDATRTTELACLYGGATVADICDFSDELQTLSSFVTDHINFAGGLSAGPLEAAGGADTTWITIGVKLPSNADNTFQGRSATMDLNWRITQV
jgi:predicted ribosomally synthesized peptide with SipW-like signal peptide